MYKRVGDWMKTFVLKDMEVMENTDGETDILKHQIPLLEGLIINREDKENRWVIEAYIEKKYYDFFMNLRETREDVMLQVKITKESNRPAFFLTSIIGINEIGANMNVLFLGTIVDKRQEIIEDMLKHLIDEGYHGKCLLEKFKEFNDLESNNLS